MHPLSFKVWQDADSQYVLAAEVVNEYGRIGWWWSDYRYKTKAAALLSPDRPA
jgi:hypothetical protein